MNSLLMLLASWFSPQPADMVPWVSANAAYTINTYAPSEETTKCCGLCDAGMITHGDGHKTPCPCPPDCECKSRVTHPPIKIHHCPDGKCNLKQSR